VIQQQSTIQRTPETERFLSEILGSSTPHVALREFRHSGLLAKVIPEFVDCWGVRGEQDQKWHPEGDVFEHIASVLQELAHCRDSRVRLAGIAHDLGKPLTFFRDPSGHISNRGHEHVSANLFESLIGPRLGLTSEMISEVSWLCRYHMIPQFLRTTPGVDPGIIDEICTHPLRHELVTLHVADVHGAQVAPELRRDNSVYLRQLIAEREGVAHVG
jgi:hypothetical protein